MTTLKFDEFVSEEYQGPTGIPAAGVSVDGGDSIPNSSGRPPATLGMASTGDMPGLGNGPEREPGLVNIPTDLPFREKGSSRAAAWGSVDPWSSPGYDEEGMNESVIGDWMKRKLNPNKDGKDFILQEGDRVVPSNRVTNPRFLVSIDSKGTPGIGTVIKYQRMLGTGTYMYLIEWDNVETELPLPVAGNDIKLDEKRDDYLKRMLRKDPGFPSTEYFRLYAPPEIKAQYPEAGTDFGFFDTRKEGMNESLEEDIDYILTRQKDAGIDYSKEDLHKMDPSTVKETADMIRKGEGDPVPVDLPDGHYEFNSGGNFTRNSICTGIREWRVDGKLHREDGPAIQTDQFEAWFVDGRLHRECRPAIVNFKFRMAPVDENKWALDGRVMSEEEYVRTLSRIPDFWERKIVEDPLVVNTPFFQKYAPREFRDKYPEAGADFGFFNTKKVDEEIRWPWRKKETPLVDLKDGDWVLHSMEGDKLGITSHCETQLRNDPEPSICNVDFEDGSSRTAASRPFLTLVDNEYIRGRIAMDPGFVTSEFFRRNASPEFKAEYPEAGTDFGFFDSRKNETKNNATRMNKRLRAFEEFETVPNAPVTIGDDDHNYILDNQDVLGLDYDERDLATMSPTEVKDIADQVREAIGEAPYPLKEGIEIPERPEGGIGFVTTGSPRSAMPFVREKTREAFAQQLAAHGYEWLGNEITPDNEGSVELVVTDNVSDRTNRTVTFAHEKGIPMKTYAALVGQHKLRFDE